MSASMDLTFPAGSGDGAVQCLSVNIINNGDTSHQIETFTVTLTTTDTMILRESVTTIIIGDSNGKD